MLSAITANIQSLAMLQQPPTALAVLALFAAALVLGVRARPASKPSLWLTYDVCCLVLLGPVLLIALPLSGTAIAISAFVLAPLPGTGVWLWRGAHRRHDDEPGDDGPGGGGDDGPDPWDPLPGGQPVDWAAFERQFWAYVRERELVPA